MTILERRIAILNNPHTLMVVHTFDKSKDGLRSSTTQ